MSGLREPLHHAGGPQHGERARVQPGARAPPPLPAAPAHGALPPARSHGDHRRGLHLHLLNGPGPGPGPGEHPPCTPMPHKANEK